MPLLTYDESLDKPLSQYSAVDYTQQYADQMARQAYLNKKFEAYTVGASILVAAIVLSLLYRRRKAIQARIADKALEVAASGLQFSRSVRAKAHAMKTEVDRRAEARQTTERPPASPDERP